MTTQPQQPNPIQDNYYYPDDEIELIDYLRVLWKWKWMISLITFVCMVAAGVAGLMTPKIYEISTTIEPGVIGIRENEGPVYLDSAANIKGKIEAGIYNSRILETLDIDSPKTQVNFKAANPGNTNLIKISSEWEQNQIATGTKILTRLLTELSHDYEKVVQAKKGDIDNQIMVKQNQIAMIEAERKSIDKRILLKLSDIQKKKDQIKLQQANLKNIKKNENALIQGVKGGKNNIFPLLYFGVEIEKLNKDMNDIKTEIEMLEIQKTERSQAEINVNQAEIGRLNIQKSYIENIKVISEPEASMFPVKPKTKLNVALAGVVGFMLSVFMAFFAEYIQKSKKERAD